MSESIEPLSVSLTRAARRQREIEGRRAISGFLRRWADRVYPDDTYQPIRGRVWLGARGLEFEYTAKPPVPDNSGIPLFIRSADRAMIDRR